MRVMLAGDVHGNTSHMLTLLDNAKKAGADRIFQLGDFGAWEHTASGVKFFDDVSRHALSRNIVVYFLRGNHDKSSLILEKYSDKKNDEGFVEVRPNLYFAPDGLRWTWEGVRFIALGGAYSVDKGWRVRQERDLTRSSEIKAQHSSKAPEDFSGTLWFPEEEMTDEQFMDIMNADGSPVDVILSHDKPRGSNPAWNRKDILDCIPNQNRLQHALVELEAKRLYHGHLHFRYTDRVPTKDGRYAYVTGLDCDPQGSYSSNAADSWVFMDLPWGD